MVGDIRHDDTVNPTHSGQHLDELLEDEDGLSDTVDQVMDALQEDVVGDILHDDTVNP